MRIPTQNLAAAATVVVEKIIHKMFIITTTVEPAITNSIMALIF